MRADTSASMNLELPAPPPGLLLTLSHWVSNVLAAKLPAWASRTKRLRNLRRLCQSILGDLRTESAQTLRDRVRMADHASEFWHMRPRIFDAVSEVHGERVAAERMSQLDTVLRVHHDRRAHFRKSAMGTTTQAATLSPPGPKASAVAAAKRRRATDRSSS
jgi:hypothetical protein